jgi:hypothetical protein
VIGCNPNYPEHFEGLIDEVRVYNRALNPGEIQPDIVGPTVPTNLEAVLESEENETEVSWTPSTDPAFADGHPGSGLRNYSFRYRLEGGSWSSWQSTFGISFVIPETTEGDRIRVNVIATDMAGNVSPLRADTLVTEPTMVTPENVGEEAVNETGNPTLASEPAYLGEMFEKEEAFSRLEAFEEKLCASNPSPCGKYNGRDAANYSIKWNLTDLGQEDARFRSNRNFDYFGGQGGDCTNYVSQALYNGGIRFMRANGINDPDARELGVPSNFEHGNSSWWSYFTSATNGPFAIRDYEVTESWVRAYVLRDHLLTNGLGKVVLSGERIKVGDIIFYDLHGLNLANADHSQIVVAVGKRKIWVAQHSPGYIQTFKRVLNRNNTPDHKLFVDWEYQVVRPLHTAANIQD